MSLLFFWGLRGVEPVLVSIIVFLLGFFKIFEHFFLVEGTTDVNAIDNHD